MRRTKQLPAERKDRNTLWKLVEARRTQLADAITAARIPFFLGLTWSFIWFAALYANSFSYVEIMSKRYQGMSSIFHGIDDIKILSVKEEDIKSEQIPLKARVQRAWNLCESKIFGNSKIFQFAGQAYDMPDDWKFKVCKEKVESGYNNSRKIEMEFTLVQMPAGLGRLHISDFGVMGNAGLILILAWSYYATRRENHAIRSFIDFDDDQRKILPAFPKEFNLRPQDPNLSAEHYCYSYYAVAQRFLFLFSTHSRPLMSSTIALGLVPLFVSTLNLWTDILSLLRRPEDFELAVHYQVSVTFALTAVVWFVTFLILRVMIETSVLLNGWLLAVNDVWIEDWNENEDDPKADCPAKDVVVYVTRQFAVRADKTASQPR